MSDSEVPRKPTLLRWVKALIGLRPSKAAWRAVAVGMLPVCLAPVASAQQSLTRSDIAQPSRPQGPAQTGTPVPDSPSAYLRIEALPQPHSPLTVDLQALSRGFEASGDSRPGTLTPQAARERLLIFISFSMPAPTLDRLVEQAARARATLVLRGLVHGSLRETASRLHRLIGNRQVAAQIDPEAFERYGVSVTPTFVLVRPSHSGDSCAQASCPSTQGHAKVAGDVSLDHAMQYLVQGTHHSLLK